MTTDLQIRSIFCLPDLEYLTYLFCLTALRCFLSSPSCFKNLKTNKTNNKLPTNEDECHLSTCSQISDIYFCLPALCYFLFSASCLKYQITNPKQITHSRQTQSFLSTCSQIFYISFLFTYSPLFSFLSFMFQISNNK